MRTEQVKHVLADAMVGMAIAQYDRTYMARVYHRARRIHRRHPEVDFPTAMAGGWLMKQSAKQPDKDPLDYPLGHKKTAAAIYWEFGLDRGIMFTPNILAQVDYERDMAVARNNERKRLEQWETLPFHDVIFPATTS